MLARIWSEHSCLQPAIQKQSYKIIRIGKGRTLTALRKTPKQSKRREEHTRLQSNRSTQTLIELESKWLDCEPFKEFPTLETKLFSKKFGLRTF